MNSSLPPSVSIEKLEEARQLALRDAVFYPQIVDGVLPIIGPSAGLQIRRWGADFLAEVFACPSLAAEQKQQLTLKVLPALKGYLDTQGQDAAVVKSVVQSATSIYPLVFKHIISNPNDSESWHNMVAIKSNILKRMDSSPSGVKVCCVKFIQRVVQIQTPGLIADPRKRPEQNEISLALVPTEHPLLSPPNLQAEAFGLLDRLLSVFQENTSDDALIITATLNSVGVLVRARASVANRILNAILNFDPFRLASLPLTPRVKVMVKSMERTIRAFLLNLNKRNPNHPLSGRVHGYLDRLQQSRAEVFEESGRKRTAPGDTLDGTEQSKRQRLGGDALDTPPQSGYGAPLPPGPITLAQMFTLTDNEAYKNFDARGVQWEALFKVLLYVLGAVDQAQVASAVNAVRARYLYYSQPQANASLGSSAAVTSLGADDDEEYQPMDGSEQIMNRLDGGQLHGLRGAGEPPEMALGPYTVPQPPPMSESDLIEYGQGTIARVFGMVDELQEPAASKAKASGFNRLAASNYDRDSWVTVVSRLATRSLAGLEPVPSAVKKEEEAETFATGKMFSVGDTIRESIYRYVIDDFRRRIDIAIGWLNEEWYNDKVQQGEGEGEEFVQNYSRWVLRVFDGILPYIDAKDNKVLIRFLSEIPEITQDILERVKRLARDPERVQLATSSILYLILLRPPCRTICIDALEDLYLNYDDAKVFAAKILQKWRPQAVQQTPSATPAPGGAPIVKSPSAGPSAIAA